METSDKTTIDPETYRDLGLGIYKSQDQITTERDKRRQSWQEIMDTNKDVT